MSSASSLRGIDADAAVAWIAAVHPRWLADFSFPAVVEGCSLDSLRELVSATVSMVALRMADAGDRAGGPCSKDPTELEAWLFASVDALAIPDGSSRSDRLIPSFGPLPQPSDAPLVRWLATFREQVQRAGIGWLRGTDAAPFSFGVFRVGSVWTVVEHGWPPTPDKFRRGVVDAVADAMVLAARDRGVDPPPVLDDVARQFLVASDDYCGRPDAALPSFALGPGAPRG